MSRNDDDRNEEREDRIRQLMERAQKHMRTRPAKASAKKRAQKKKARKKR
jgi:hypothetical protein